MVELTVKKYADLTRDELYSLMAARMAVFVVEQNCPYQDADGRDDRAVHLWLHENDEILAYARVLEAGTVYDEVAIGRVLSTKRGCGYGYEIVRAAIEAAENYYRADSIRIEAQSYAREFYERFGFVKVSDEFLEDGIPHIEMLLNMKNEE